MTQRIVVVGVTRGGAELAARLAAALPMAEAHVAPRWAGLAQGARPLDEPLATVLPKLFRDPSVGGLIVVLAVGATVRLLAPWLRGKAVDPAVVVVDDAGHFAVALLSGHRGGANALARRVADVIGACPVVTTASDSTGHLAVDLLGADEGWKIEATPDAVRRAAAAVVNGDPVGVYQDAGSRAWQAAGLPDGIQPLDSLDAASVDGLSALLLISDRDLATPPLPEVQPVIYRPPTLVAGVGCSRGAAEADVAATIELALARGGLARGSLVSLATLDRRLDEPGLVSCARQLGLPLRGFPAEALARVPRMPTPSAVVEAAVGTPGVCEPAALLASGATELVVAKVKTARATAAIARIPVHGP